VPAARIQDDSQRVLRFAVASFLGHLTLFGLILFSPDFLPEKRYLPSVIDVSIVSVNPAPTARRTAGPQTTAPPQPAESEVPEPPPEVPEPPPAPAAAPVPVKPPPPETAAPVEQEAVSIAPKAKDFKEKTSLKRKTIVAKPEVQPPPPPAAQQPGARPEPVKSAIERLKKTLQSPPPGSPAKPGVAGGGTAAGSAGGASGWPGSGTGGDLIDVYKAEIASRIQQNWAFSEQLAGGRKDLQAVIVLRILPSGEIGESWFEKRSGNDTLDDSAFRAVQKSNPLPPLPRGYFRSYYEVGLIFTPEGIQ